jgi:hypothetical protein
MLSFFYAFPSKIANEFLNFTRRITTSVHIVLIGRATAEAVSRWLPTAATRVWQVGFVVDKVASGQVFS